MPDKLLSYLIGKNVPPAELSEITEGFKFKKLNKGDYFVEEGKTSKYMAFVTKGMFRYFYSKDGSEITTYVSGENAFLVSLSSFFKQKPSKENIRAIADSEMLMIHYDDLVKLKTTNDAFKKFYLKALEDLVVSMDDTRTNLIILTAEERYALLIKDEPALLQKIPLQYLASILGVTPRHLSRIRNNIS